MTENNKETLFTRTRKATTKDIDIGKQARKFRIDENGNICTGNPSAHWLPDVKFTEEIGGTIYTVTGSYKGTDTANQKASRILFQNLKNMEDEQ